MKSVSIRPVMDALGKLAKLVSQLSIASFMLSNLPTMNQLLILVHLKI